MNGVLQIMLLAVFPPLMLGIINKTKALVAGRVGAPVLQPYYDLARLFRKNGVVSHTTTWVFLAGPVIGLVTVFIAGLLLPIAGTSAPIRFTGDLILFAYLFALGRFFTTAAALDTGSAFEGMGAAREVTFACFTEPALFFVWLVLARLSGTLNLSGMLPADMVTSWTTAGASLFMVAAALFVVLLAENCRIPVDDPNTHLELTMIHEVMVLDHSGPALGAILYAAAIKLFVISVILARIIAPIHTGRVLVDCGILIVAVMLLAVLVGIVESIMARLRLLHVPMLLISACLLSGLAFLLLGNKP